MEYWTAHREILQDTEIDMLYLTASSISRRRVDAGVVEHAVLPEGPAGAGQAHAHSRVPDRR
ncbi:MAG: hypothetical protein ABI790_04585 [Betaproteobacteria bacterium]